MADPLKLTAIEEDAVAWVLDCAAMDARIAIGLLSGYTVQRKAAIGRAARKLDAKRREMRKEASCSRKKL